MSTSELDTNASASETETNIQKSGFITKPSDVGKGIVLRWRNAFGEPKTSRHNRPPRPKKLLEKREKIATRKSKRILEMHATKKELDKVNINIPEKCS